MSAQYIALDKLSPAKRYFDRWCSYFKQHAISQSSRIFDFIDFTGYKKFKYCKSFLGKAFFVNYWFHDSVSFPFHFAFSLCLC